MIINILIFTSSKKVTQQLLNFIWLCLKLYTFWEFYVLFFIMILHKFLIIYIRQIEGWCDWGRGLESVAWGMISLPSLFSHQYAGGRGIVAMLFAFGDTTSCTSPGWWHQHSSWPDDRRHRPATPPSSHQPAEQPPGRRWSAESPDAPNPSWLPLWKQNEHSRRSSGTESMAEVVLVG